MDQIIRAYQKVLAKKSVFYVWLTIFGVFFSGVWIPRLTPVPQHTALILMVLIGLIIIGIIRFKINTAGSILTRKVLKKEDVTHFQETIDAELQASQVLIYHDDVYELSLFRTESWIALFHTGKSFIRRSNTVANVQTVFLPSKSISALEITFSDNEMFLIRCGSSCDEILELLK